MFLLEKMVNPLQNALFKRCWIEKAINKERQKRAEKSKTEFEPIEHFYPHALGHTLATRLYDDGVSIQTIRDYMGHFTEDMTKQYVDYMPKKIEKANEDYFKKPGNNLAMEITVKKRGDKK